MKSWDKYRATHQVDALASKEPVWNGFLMVDGRAGACRAPALTSGAAVREELVILWVFGLAEEAREETATLKRTVRSLCSTYDYRGRISIDVTTSHDQHVHEQGVCAPSIAGHLLDHMQRHGDSRLDSRTASSCPSTLPQRQTALEPCVSVRRNSSQSWRGNTETSILFPMLPSVHQST